MFPFAERIYHWYQMEETCVYVCERILTAENQNSGRMIYPNASFVHQESHVEYPDIEPDLHLDEPASMSLYMLKIE